MYYRKYYGLPLLLAVSGLLFVSYANAQSNVYVVEDKCGDCHTVDTLNSNGEFEKMVANYNWPRLPLRTWLSNHHRPRIPSVSINEAQVTSVESYIQSLINQSESSSTNNVEYEKSTDYNAHSQQKSKIIEIESSKCLNC